MTNEKVACAGCGATVTRADRFCERCGTVLADVRRVAIPRSAGLPDAPCADCGNPTYADDYCTRCGSRRAQPDRDQTALDAIVLITDRGHAHARNEDAAAAGVVAGASYAMAVAVCDGVSTSSDAHTAAVGASRAGVDAMLRALIASRSAHSAVIAGLNDAAMAAATAGLSSQDPTAPASCTYTAAVVVATTAGSAEITVGNVGDSRVYWIPDPPATAQCLTVDDSLAHELITAGVPADSHAAQTAAHTLTRWLGADAEPTPWSASSVRTIAVADPGALVICTDGLWNYLPEADDIARLCAGKDATTAAHALVDYALSEGGQDNITVAIVPIGDRA